MLMHLRQSASVLALAATLLLGGVRAADAQVVQYYHLDALGSVRALTDQTGAVVARYDYEPFGEPVTPPAPPHERRQFTGHVRDAETGLDYFGARYYRADLGRFLTVDPGNASATLPDPQGWNAYGYARNNPFMYVDPDGRQWQVPPGSPGSRDNPFRVTVTGCDSDCQARESFNRFVFEHRFQLIATEVSERAGALASPKTYLEFYGLSAVGGLGVGSGVSLFGNGGLTSLSFSTSPYALWPTALAGPTVINGIYYTVHALERMAPVGLGIGRGVPVSVVENAIRFGTTMPGNKVGTVVHVFENVSVVTNLASNRVITVIVTGR